MLMVLEKGLGLVKVGDDCFKEVGVVILLDVAISGSRKKYFGNLGGVVSLADSISN